MFFSKMFKLKERQINLQEKHIDMQSNIEYLQSKYFSTTYNIVSMLERDKPPLQYCARVSLWVHPSLYGRNDMLAIIWTASRISVPKQTSNTFLEFLKEKAPLSHNNEYCAFKGSSLLTRGLVKHQLY